MSKPWSAETREMLEKLAELAEWSDDARWTNPKAIRAALAEIDRLTIDEREYQNEIQIAIDRLNDALAEIDRLKARLVLVEAEAAEAWAQLKDAQDADYEREAR